MITFLLVHPNDRDTGCREYIPLIDVLDHCLVAECHLGGDVFTMNHMSAGKKVAYETYEWSDMRRAFSDTTCLVVWNGLAPDERRRAVQCVQEMHKPVAFIELTPFSDYLQIDHIGVSGSSSVARLPFDLIAGVSPSPSIQSLDWRVPTVRKKAPCENLPDGQTRALFFPMQVMTDTQLQEHLVGYGGLAEVFDAIVAGMPKNTALVVKEHPACFREDEAAYPRMREKHPGVFWCRTTPIPDIFDRVDGVVTINSSVGLQALHYGLPVLAIGHEAWIKSGVVSTVTTTLAEGMNSLMTVDPRDDQYMYNVRVLLTYLVEHWYVKRHVKDILKRINDIANGRAPWLEVLNP